MTQPLAPSRALVDFQVESGIGTITLNRPDRRNALNHELIEQLGTAWTKARDRDDVRVVILTGAGDRAFCAGADLKEYLPKPGALAQLWNSGADLRPDRGIAMWKPVVAAVNGDCLGGGITLLLATDVRISVPHARFGTPEVRWGVIASCGGTQRLMHQLPAPIALEMLLTGEPIAAATAERWGLINRIVAPSELMQCARNVACQIAANAPLAVQATKELALRSHDMSIDTALRLEDAMLRILQSTRDVQEGAAAFADKRSAQFIGE
jgi:E-phenylitaconyl-CoA hydratase